MNAIEVRNLSKRFKVTAGTTRSLKSLVLDSFRSQEPDESKVFWALRDLTFSVSKGETLGIIAPMVQVRARCCRCWLAPRFPRPVL